MIYIRPPLVLERFLPLFLVLFVVSTISLRGQDSLYIAGHYNKSEYLIPMRDGVKLFTSVYTPQDTTQTYPIILTRTPYSVMPYGRDRFLLCR